MAHIRDLFRSLSNTFLTVFWGNWLTDEIRSLFLKKVRGFFHYTLNRVGIHCLLPGICCVGGIIPHRMMRRYSQINFAARYLQINAFALERKKRHVMQLIVLLLVVKKRERQNKFRYRPSDSSYLKVFVNRAVLEKFAK